MPVKCLCLTKVGMLRERLCSVIFSVLTVVFLLCMFIVYPCGIDTPIQPITVTGNFILEFEFRLECRDVNKWPVNIEEITEEHRRKNTMAPANTNIEEACGGSSRSQ